MTGADLAQVAALHISAFPGFFLTSLGGRALRELYMGMIDDSRGVAVVAAENGRIVGFAAGAVDARVSYRRLFLRRWWRFARAIAPNLVRQPVLIARLAWRVRSAAGSASDHEALLSSLAVAPAAQGRGVGRTLVREFVSAARQKGSRSVSLTTDAAENDKVERFYQSIGFRRRRASTTPENRRIHEYVIDL